MTKPVLPADLVESLDPATILVRGGATHSPHDETREALFMTSGMIGRHAGIEGDAVSGGPASRPTRKSPQWHARLGNWFGLT